MNRTAFLIDGFNVYHSVKQASYDLGLRGRGTKWLDFHNLCVSYLSAIGNNAQIEGIYYFSALATHLQANDPDVVKRHNNYITCLRDIGITVELGRFKPKQLSCDNCRVGMVRHEEKETDVAIALKLIEVFILDQCDTVVLISGDTDIAPAIRMAKGLYPNKTICVAFPYKRKNRELANISDHSFNITKNHYTRHQLPDPFICQDGRTVSKPRRW